MKTRNIDQKAMNNVIRGLHLQEETAKMKGLSLDRYSELLIGGWLVEDYNSQIHDKLKTVVH